MQNNTNKSEQPEGKDQHILLLSVYLGKDAEGKNKYFQILIPSNYTKEDLEEVYEWASFIMSRLEKTIQKSLPPSSDNNNQNIKQ